MAGYAYINAIHVAASLRVAAIAVTAAAAKDENSVELLCCTKFSKPSASTVSDKDFDHSE